jgi:CHAD domain-containing protein
MDEQPRTVRITGHAIKIRAMLPKRAAKPTRNATLTEQLTATIDRRLRDLLDHESGTREGTDPEDLHQMRVAVRRIRAALKAAEPALETPWTTELRDELGELAGRLGEVRDTDVLIEHFHTEIAALSEEDQSAGHKLLARLNLRRTAARGHLVGYLDGPRYAALLNTLAAAVRDGVPSTGEKSVELGTSLRKLGNLVAAAGDSPPDEVLHKLRIRAKRFRYSTEMARKSIGKPAKNAIRATAELQDILGKHQDAAVAQQEIRDWMKSGTIDAETAFVAGQLMERERNRKLAARNQWRSAWLTVKKVSHKL